MARARPSLPAQPASNFRSSIRSWLTSELGRRGTPGLRPSKIVLDLPARIGWTWSPHTNRSTFEPAGTKQTRTVIARCGNNNRTNGPEGNLFKPSTAPRESARTASRTHSSRKNRNKTSRVPSVDPSVNHSGNAHSRAASVRKCRPSRRTKVVPTLSERQQRMDLSGLFSNLPAPLSELLGDVGAT